jgi:2-polyprenyl-3-methyl-5-hydroxy-6-metoxy-1,4-benzoquinol methylase
MSEAAERLGPKLIQLAPAPLRPLLDTAHRPLARYLLAGKYRRKYRGRFVSRIDPEDDLFQWGLGDSLVQLGWARDENDDPASRYDNAVRGYFAGGDWNAHQVEGALHDVGCSLREARSFLEFACGYGRLTRHFVHMIGPAKITVSDIDRRAVDFVRKHFGVGGFYSATMAEELTHADRYDVIVAVSLFSHLSVEQWGPWLTRLHKLLNPEGLLLLTTHNSQDCDPEDFQAKAEGFLYREENETRGRLSVAHYGAAFVSEKYVERAVSENFTGRLLRYSPHALLLHQDIYVLQRVDRIEG